ncbi:hypothetical protein RIF29_21536 [Crotalaria pallida]|uniref:Embryo sac development arrest 6 n=1 Tax=Crotalaria pallida TaxID=3830 RepID=A0AAN9F355_CROPI
MMKNHHPLKMLPPGTSRKRKHTEADEPAKPKAAEPVPSNRLLAGFLAHEFLTKGSLFGQKFDTETVRAYAEPLTGPTTAKPNRSQLNSQAVEPSRPSVRKEQESYGEVASIMKTDGTHIKGIVNPTQLSRWIHM